jgi:hypothetical protein
LQLSKTGDKLFVSAMQSKKIKDCTIEELKQPLRRAMLKVGLRENNIPKEEEKAILFEHILTNYGGNHLDEIYLAFELAINGRLDLGPDDVNCYENFSCLYISKIMNSYRRWAAQEFRQHEKTIIPEARQLTAGEDRAVPWGMIIDQEYQHFLSFGPEKSKLWPAEFYEQLVSDGFIEEDYFRSAMGPVRQRVINDLYAEKNRLSNGSVKGMDKSRQGFAESIRHTNLMDVDKKIADYRSGARNGELILMAKQYSVLQLFNEAKGKFVEHIYKLT